MFLLGHVRDPRMAISDRSDGCRTHIRRLRARGCRAGARAVRPHPSVWSSPRLGIFRRTRRSTSLLTQEFEWFECAVAIRRRPRLPVGSAGRAVTTIDYSDLSTGVGRKSSGRGRQFVKHPALVFYRLAAPPGVLLRDNFLATDNGRPLASNLDIPRSWSIQSERQDVLSSKASKIVPVTGRCQAVSSLYCHLEEEVFCT